ncbi:MAG: sigma-54-dependent Fis family transcriptional regulator [Planctomycetes bacterium]|nr:sigma-54-dependent Fis family transcriptional regulator [Planctomycetota bacterium]
MLCRDPFEVRRPIIGVSANTLALRSRIEKVARSDSTILVSGETGTGKELVARAIHAGSLRRAGPFLAVDCGAIPPSLVDGELFGHVRGAFSGAVSSRVGRIEAANGGTLFLDEIAELDHACQTRLLRALQERVVQPVGSHRVRRFDARVVAATHRDLSAMVRQGRFREDLLYRIQVVELRVPPLRERPEDIEPLAEHFLVAFASRDGKRIIGFSPEARRALFAHPWPGNVRELENAVENAVVFCRGPLIERDDLPRSVRAGAADGDPAGRRSFEEETLRFQRDLLLRALRASGGDRQRAAERLRLTVHQVKYLLHKLDLHGSDLREFGAR